MENFELNYLLISERTNERITMIGFFALVLNYSLFDWIIRGFF